MYLSLWIYNDIFNEILLPEKEDYCSLLNMEDIADVYYADAKRVYKDFEIKNLGE